MYPHVFFSFYYNIKLTQTHTIYYALQSKNDALRNRPYSFLCFALRNGNDADWSIQTALFVLLLKIKTVPFVIIHIVDFALQNKNDAAWIIHIFSFVFLYNIKTITIGNHLQISHCSAYEIILYIRGLTFVMSVLLRLFAIVTII